MNIRCLAACLLLAVVLWVPPATIGADWPQWRGPEGSGVADGSFPIRWSADEGILWRARLQGSGSSSPIVVGDLVIVTSQVGRAPLRPGTHPTLAREDPGLEAKEQPIAGDSPGDDVRLLVEAFGRNDGRARWTHRLEAQGPFPDLHLKHNLASPTAATDGSLVFAWFGTGQIVALDLAGRQVWARHLGRDYSPFDINWGHGSSPVLAGDLLILLADHATRSYLLALDKRTGRERWKADRGSGRASYATPLVVRTPGGPEIVVNSNERIDAYDPATGRLLWHAGGPRQTPVPSPVADSGVVFLSRGYRGSPVLALRAGGRGDVSTSHLVWEVPTGAAYSSSILHYAGLVFMTNDVGVLTCADARTGERLWQVRLDGIFFASPAGGGGHVYLPSETGEVIVVRADREPRVVARNDLGERLVASPALSRGRIYFRSDNGLFAIGAAGETDQAPSK